METVRSASPRIDRLDEMMAELASSVTQLSQDSRMTKEATYYANEALRTLLSDISRDLQTNITNLALEMRQADLRARRVDEVLGQKIELLSEEIRQGVKHFHLADEALGQQIAQLSLEMRQGAEQSRLVIEQVSREMQAGAEQSRFADKRARQADERARLANEALGQKIERLSEEMRKDRLEGKKQRTHLNKNMAELSHKMGTLAEDMMVPNVAKILKDVVGCREEPQMESLRVKKRLPDGSTQEYDILAICEDYLLVCAVKSGLRAEDLRQFCKQLSIARRFLPEYSEKKIVGALGTFYVDPKLIKQGAEMGLIMLGEVDGLMMILNEEGFVPKVF